MKSGVNRLENQVIPDNHLQEKCENIINKITILDSFDEVYALIRKTYEKSEKPVVVSFLNAHGYNLCISNPSFYQCIMASDFVFRDGVGLKLLFKLLRRNPGENLNGTDLIPYLLDRLPRKKVALVGTEKTVLNKAIEHPSFKSHQVVMLEHGFLPVDEYLKPIADVKPELILLGMGMPKQEELSVMLKHSASNTKLIINGGAILDFMGNKVPRAPKLIRMAGMEWMFRLLLEPRRLFRRYVIGNFIFFKTALKFRLNHKERSI